MKDNFPEMTFTPLVVAFVKSAYTTDRANQMNSEHRLILSRKNIDEISTKANIKTPYALFRKKKGAVSVDRGLYLIPNEADLKELGVDKKASMKVQKPVNPDQLTSGTDKPKEGATTLEFQQCAVDVSLGFIPPKDKFFLKDKLFKLCMKILNSKKFMPVYIIGLSGCGKTFAVEQAAAYSKREFYRVNITAETDESDLIGSFRLIEGNTIFQEGPVTKAMRTGAILLLDEVDLGTEKILCLQSILEGKGVFLKKTNQFITPAKGFTIFATANTKGAGDDTGKFVGANYLNEAFLERFPITYEQNYPSMKSEINLLKKHYDGELIDVQNLASWAKVVRAAYDTTAISDVVTTRRLVQICQTADIFGLSEAIRLCLNRFDSSIRQAMMDMHEQVTSVVIASDADETSESKVETGDSEPDEAPF